MVVDLAVAPLRARDLEAGGMWVPGCALPLNTECDLLVCAPAGELRVVARVVYRDADRGAGLEVMGARSELLARVQGLLGGGRAGAASPAGDPPRGGATAAVEAGVDPGACDPRGSSAGGGDGATEWVAEGTDEPAQIRDRWATQLDSATPAAGAPSAEPADGTADEPGGELGPGRSRGGDASARTALERLRHLPLAQQIKKAHAGELPERIALERMYGKAVWEALLRNPRITAPEVARIARMGTLPRPLIELIVGNGAWLQVPEVRRALLANPRLQLDQILRVLRLVPRPELKLATVQTAYPHAVRDAAKRLLKELA